MVNCQIFLNLRTLSYTFMKKIILFFILLFSISRTYSQQFLWAKQFGGKGQEQASSVCADPDRKHLHDGTIWLESWNLFRESPDWKGPFVQKLIIQ